MNAPARSDIIRGRAQQMVRAHEAPDFHTALSVLSKRAAASRRRHRRNQARAQNAWYNRENL